MAGSVTVEQATVWLLERDEVERLWGYICPQLRRAAAERVYGETDMPAIVQAIEAGKLQVGIIEDGDGFAGVFALEIFGNDNGKLLDVSLVAGENREAWLPELAAKLMEIARRIGADRIRVAGRPGWRRLLDADFDCRTVATVFDVKVNK